MQAGATVNFGRGRILELTAQVDDTNPQAPMAAHQWLSDTYERLGGEPVRASGKVLLLDRILAIAVAAGYERLRDDPELAEAFVCNAVLAVGRPHLIIDVTGLTVGY